MKNRTLLCQRSLYWFLFAFLLPSSIVHAQSNIGQPLSVNEDGVAPAASAMLDVQATNKGVLVPRMNTAQRNAIASPAPGLLVFDTTTGGFWFHNGTAWTPLRTPYTAGTGISISGDVIANTGDNDSGNDITTATPAGGDLNGSFPAPVVDGLQGRALSATAPTTGQVLKYDGAQWKPDTDVSGSGGSVLLPCSEINAGGTDYKVGIGLCPPTDSVRLHVKGTATKKVGLKIDADEGLPTYRKGIEINAKDGSVSNDGVVLFSQGASGSNVTVRGAKINAIQGLVVKGMEIAAATGNTVKGMEISALNGSTSNDGIVLLSSSGNGAKGLDLTAESNLNTSIGAQMTSRNGTNNWGLKITTGDAQVESGRNIGLYLDLKDKNQNNSSGHRFRDVGLLIKCENDSDYAAFFDGDVAIPRELEFIDSTNSANGQRWALFINKGTGTAPCGTGTLQNDFIFEYENVIKGVLDSGTGGFCTTSDRRLKENIHPLSAQLPLALQLRPVSYNFISDEEKKNTVGFIAQEVEEIFPDAVNRVPDEQHGELLTLNYDAFSVIAIKAIQEQQQIIERQQAELQAQQTRLDQLEQEMAGIRAWMQSQQAALVLKKD